MIRVLLLAVGAVVVAAVALFAVAKHYRMPSSSMEPTFHCAKPAPGCEGKADDRFLVYTFLGWGRGDVVAFRAPRAAAERCGASGTFVKRVIGGPGDAVREDARGFLWRNGKRLDEPYARGRGADQFRNRRWRVPAGRWFLVGDNRSLSCDSRVFGAVPRSAVVGRVFLTYWPLSRLAFH